MIGKIEALHGDLDSDHWDGKGPLRRRFEDELADVMAAISFNIESHQLDRDYIINRANEKLALFNHWHG